MDTTLRDGEQTSGVSFNAREKLSIARLLLEELCVSRIEIASARVSQGEQEAVRRIAGRAQTECSGNVTREKLQALADIGVDYISSGALTHSAPILDISMKHLRRIPA